jgi:phosphoglycerate dehydrogenase-like enzyme
MQGGLVNYVDVLLGLTSGQVSGFAMDSIPEGCPDALRNHPRAMLSEHRVAATEVVYKCISALVARNIIRLCDGLELTDLVTPPAPQNSPSK